MLSTNDLAIESPSPFSIWFEEDASNRACGGGQSLILSKSE